MGASAVIPPSLPRRWARVRHHRLCCATMTPDSDCNPEGGEAAMATTTTTLMPLDSALKDKFKKLFRGGKKNIRELAIEAFEVHRQHYLAGEQNNFEAWWSSQGMNDIFGSRTN